MSDDTAPIEPASTRFPGDPDATWVYWGPHDTVENGIPDEWVWERLRFERDERLRASDHRILGDVPWDIKPWIDYRAALRDLPATTTDPRQARWPAPPDARKEQP